MILTLLVLLLWEPLINLPLLSNIIPKWIGLTIVILFIIWMTNLYNFMDGIDGISSTQSIIIGIGVGACLFLSQDVYKLENILAGFFVGAGAATVSVVVSTSSSSPPPQAIDVNTIVEANIIVRIIFLWFILFIFLFIKL